MRRAALLALLFACKRGAEQAPPPPAAPGPAQVQEQEPNDFQHAQQLPASAVVSGELSAPRDEDWFRLAPAEGPSALRLELKPSSAAELEVYDRDRRRVLGVKAGGDEFGVVPAVACAESCFVKVSGAGPQTYKLTVLASRADPARELEPNDDAAQAQELQPGKPLQGTFYAPGDQDWYRLATPQPGQMLRVDTTPVEGVREELEIRSVSDGGVIGAFQGGSVRALRVEEPADGGYFLVLRGRSKRGAPLLPYTLTASLQAAPPDLEAEPNDDIAHATPLHGTASGYLSPPGDVDFYRLESDAGAILRAEVSGPDGGVELALLAPDGGILARAELSLPAVGVPAGDSYLRVRGDWPEEYRLSAQLLPDDGTLEREPNDSIASAQELALPAQVKGTIWPARDVDFFRFHVPAGRPPVSVVLSRVRGLDLQLRLLEVRGDRTEVIGSSHGARGEGEEKLLSVPLKEGDYAVEVQSPRKDASRTDPYTLSVR